MSADRFDARDWLRRFEAVGGWYAVADGKVHAGWRLDGIDQETAVREVWREIKQDEQRRADVRAVLLAAAA